MGTELGSLVAVGGEAEIQEDPKASVSLTIIALFHPRTRGLRVLHPRLEEGGFLRAALPVSVLPAEQTTKWVGWGCGWS